MSYEEKLYEIVYACGHKQNVLSPGACDPAGLVEYLAKKENPVTFGCLCGDCQKARKN
jgi:hypothetical protein